MPHSKISSINIWVASNFSTTKEQVSNTLLNLTRQNKLYSIQQITFESNNFTTISLVCYKIKEIFDKYLMNNFLSWYYDQKI